MRFKKSHNGVIDCSDILDTIKIANTTHRARESH